MGKDKLSKEEKSLLDAVEAGEFESVFTQDRRKDLEAITGNTSRKHGMVRNWLTNPDNASNPQWAHTQVRPYGKTSPITFNPGIRKNVTQ